ncbi:thymidylate kinase [Babesia caballi]|uniref:Thymidylate kinase n=1 Tax=Babesia caballi TaxID=5871 RepID=A0AAV4LLP2_BABCB|nr:thymidylate kinase [Babesia caballi]
MDRYAFSGVAYSVGAEKLYYDWCVAADEGLVSPDLVVYLDNPAHVSAMRRNFGRPQQFACDSCLVGEERYEQECKLEGVRQVYGQFASLPYWRSFDATLSPEVGYIFMSPR